MKNLLSAIYGKCAGSALNTDIGGKLYYGKAPQGTTGKYVVYQLITDYPDYMFRGRIEEATIQFSVFSDNRTSAVEVLTTAGYLKSLYDDCTLSVSSYTFYKMEREFETLETDPDDETYYSVIQYRVLIGV